ncbi:MAG: sigma 54-interacting transcriptional regulator, partial [Oscillospiraceae bacterium]|nr:sigma 54-interacting transcriptional regulator [Oscillospiraceae bacterium]
MLAKIDGEYRGIIAESPVIREKLEIMTKAANTDSTVLLLGEGGTGKEFFAEKIHQSSSRYDKPFVKQSCAEKSGKTIEIKKAGGGTLFFDEIGDLSAALQADLLKIIRKGGDYRILAATRIDIEKQAEKGAFCRDLYHRLNVFIICIPPLRQRGEDIPALADIFLKKSMAETKNSFKGFSRRS